MKNNNETYVAYKAAKAAKDAAWKNLVAAKVGPSFGVAWCAHEAACRAFDKTEAAIETSDVFKYHKAARKAAWDAKDAARKGLQASDVYRAYENAAWDDSDEAMQAKETARHLLHTTEEWKTYDAAYQAAWKAEDEADDAIDDAIAATLPSTQTNKEGLTI